MTGPADQLECTRVVVETTPDAAIIANLGAASHLLLEVEDRDRNFYMTGAMGSTTATAFGVALGTDDEVTVLEGDGSLLMTLGTLVTVGHYDPSNLTIVVWKNNVYETTGGQPLLAPKLDFSEIARECGIEAWQISSVDGFRDAYEKAQDVDGASLIEAHVETVYPEDPVEPNYYGHSHVKHRFRQALTG